MRSVERAEGLALAGSATVGPVRFSAPCVLETREAGEAGTGPFLSPAIAPSGARRVVLGDGPTRIEVEFPVLTPEVTSSGTGVVPLEDRTVLLHAPLDREALRGLRTARPELLILGNARALWNEGLPFVTAVGLIRTELGAEPLLWAPRLALPNRLPFLAYVGIDLVDTTEGELGAANGTFLDPTLGPRTPSAEAAPRGCDCPACSSIPPGTLAAHARFAYRRAALELRAALNRGALRELVEARLASEPTLAELLRYTDRELGGLLEGRAPVASSGVHSYVLAEGLRRPEMRRFRDRLVERYRPPPSKSVLLLVPCSRTKPYRHSPSHRRFVGALEGLPAAERVHFVSVSSPIGVVPRELEDLPPARHYDIPVTGDWTADEQEVVLRGIRHLVSAGAYRAVVVHLDPDEYRFVLEALAGHLPTEATVVDGRPTSPASVARLRDALVRSLAASSPVPGGPLAVVREELREVASVQFGRVAAERLFAPPVRLAGRPWFQRVTDGRSDLASLREERGLFHLTVAGAVRLGDAVPRIDVEPGLTLDGDLFAPGVLHADPAIRSGDAVGLFQRERLNAVGEAVLPGPLLGDLRHGLAVRVRHRRHEAADTAKSADPPSLAGR